MNYEDLAAQVIYDAEVWHRKYLETLDRLHMAKRRAREDKVKLRNVIASYRESHEELRQIIEDQREHMEFMESLNDPWNE